MTADILYGEIIRNHRAVQCQAESDDRDIRIGEDPGIPAFECRVRCLKYVFCLRLGCHEPFLRQDLEPHL